MKTYPPRMDKGRLQEQQYNLPVIHDVLAWAYLIHLAKGGRRVEARERILRDTPHGSQEASERGADQGI